MEPNQNEKITRYFVLDANGEIVYGPEPVLSVAVEAAARYDGFGACYQRDKEGRMRLYSSARHIGNNPYTPAEADVFIMSASYRKDDAAAIEGVAAQIVKGGVFHSRYDLDIVAVVYDSAGNIVTVNGETLATRNQYADDLAEAIAQDRARFGLSPVKVRG
jgi:hypothetical protein